MKLLVTKSLLAFSVLLCLVTMTANADTGTLVITGHVDVTSPSEGQVFYVRGIPWSSTLRIPPVVPESSVHSVSAKVPFSDNDPNFEQILVVLSGFYKLGDPNQITAIGASQDSFLLHNSNPVFLDPYTLSGNGKWFVPGFMPIYGKTLPRLSMSSDPTRPPDQDFPEVEDWVFAPVFWLPF